jgi:hypothetical protein
LSLIARLRHRLKDDARLSSMFKGSASAIAGKGLTMVISAAGSDTEVPSVHA